MNDFCECGHNPNDHYAETGHCEHFDRGLWGDEQCKCAFYVYQGDE
jgi:hypothetical protein